MNITPKNVNVIRPRSRISFTLRVHTGLSTQWRLTSSTCAPKLVYHFKQDADSFTVGRRVATLLAKAILGGVPPRLDFAGHGVQSLSLAGRRHPPEERQPNNRQGFKRGREASGVRKWGRRDFNPPLT